MKSRSSFHLPRGLAIAAVLLGGASVLPAQRPNSPLTNFWYPDGAVNAIAEAEGVVYVGGRFNYVGPYTGSAAVLDAATGTRDAGFPLANGQVTAAVPDGAGGWFIGGAFSFVGGVPQQGLAHILADNTVDPNWTGSVIGTVYALALSGNTLYVGGEIALLSGEFRSLVGALDATTGAVRPWNTNTAALFINQLRVNAIAVSGNTVFVGGGFTNMAGVTRTNLAALDVTTGVATAWNPAPNSPVNALVASGNTVCVGGTFTRIAGQNRTNLAALNATTGVPLAWTDGANSGVRALALSGGTLYAAGFFSRIGGTDRHGVAALDAATGVATAWNPGTGIVGNPNSPNGWALAVSGGTVFIGGGFTLCGGQPRLRLAAVSGASGNALATWNPGANAIVQTLAADGSRVLAAGIFTSIGGVQRNGLAALNVATGAATSWNPEPDFYATVKSIAPGAGVIFVGGAFTNVGGLTRKGLVAISAATGSVTAWDANLIVPPNVSPGVETLLLSGNTLYVGGAFNNINSQFRTNLAALEATTAAVGAWSPGANRGAGGQVKTMALIGGALFLGGDFTLVGGQSRTNLAAVDATSGNVLPWNPGANAPVNSLAATDNAIYAGGRFTRVGGQARTNVVSLDPATGSLHSWDPGLSLELFPSEVWAVRISSNAIFVGGSFDRVGAGFRSDLAEVDKASAQVTDWDPLVGRPDNAIFNFPTVYTLGVGANHLYAGGDFPGHFVAYPLDGPPPPPPPQLTLPMLDNGFFRFRLLGTDGQSYVIETSGDLNFWQPLDTVMPVGGHYDYTDVNPAEVFEFRAYRAYVVP